jgi:hypothetical protein
MGYCRICFQQIIKPWSDMKNFICICLMVFISISGCSREPQKTAVPTPSAESKQQQKTEALPSTASVPAQGAQARPARTEVAAATTLLATVAEDEKPEAVNPTVANIHPSIDTTLQVIFSEWGGGVAYVVGMKGDKVYVVHNGRPGSLYGAFGEVVLSPDGSRFAYGAMTDGKWRMVLDGKEGELFSSVRNPKFSPDGRHLAYQGMKGDLWQLIMDGAVISSTKTRYRPHEFSGDSARIAYIDNVDEKTLKGRLVVSDIYSKNERTINTGVTDMVLNADKTTIAAISRNPVNRERMIQFDFAKPDAIIKGAEYDKIVSPVFGPSGTDLAYFGERKGRIYGVFRGQEEILPEGVTPGTPVINQAGKSVGVLMSANDTVYLYQMFRNSGRKGSLYDEAEWLVYSSDGTVSAFAARKGGSWFVVVNGKEGPAYDRVVAPVFSPDGKRLVYRARKEGRRFVVIADANGKTIRQHPEYEQVFQPVFTADGKSVAYGVKDGRKLIWKVEKLDK